VDPFPAEHGPTSCRRLAQCSLLRLESAWGAKRSEKAPASPNLTRSWAGIENWLARSSTAPNSSTVIRDLINQAVYQSGKGGLLETILRRGLNADLVIPRLRGRARP